ncbi:MAG TPA: diphthine--ammonia ligase [Pirellulales bacterium]|nr:diphthine--ammonia ligase [Pirellulales bacterium]
MIQHSGDSREPVLLSWSGGKDSALALYYLRRMEQQYEVVGLLTTVSDEYRRVSHHGVQEVLLDRQAAALGLPLDKLYVPTNSTLPCTHEQFVQMMGEKLTAYRDAGVRYVAHGDIFLEDLRRYRETNLARLGMQGVFPLWHRDTTELVEEFVSLGFRAVLSCIDGQKLDESFVGREIDHSFLGDLPPTVDPCGEYGEYHSFVYDGPIFREPIGVHVGERVQREQRWYVELLPSDKLHVGAATARYDNNLIGSQK